MGLSHRVRQFWSAVTARVTAHDCSFVEEYLAPGEQALFYQMAVFDQVHCLATARAVQILGRARGVGPSKIPPLVKAALLHDVGKVAGDIGLWDRVFITLLGDVNPGAIARLSKRAVKIEKRGFSYACQVHLDHAVRGAHMLECFGVDERVVALVREHHRWPDERQADALAKQDQMLEILRDADRVN